MKHFLVGGISAGVVFGIASAVFAFTEPSMTPPSGNTPAPITTGGGRQVKAGDLSVANLTASTITLGGETRASWLDAGASCAWTGWKCDCRDNGSTFADVELTVGMKCAGGQLADMKIISLQISSRDKSCGSAAPAPCDQRLFSHNGIFEGASVAIPDGKQGTAAPFSITVPSGKQGEATPPAN